MQRACSNQSNATSFIANNPINTLGYGQFFMKHSDNALQAVHFSGESLRFLDLADAAAFEASGEGFVWVFADRDALHEHSASLQTWAQSLGGSQIIDLHLQDLGNPQHPSHYDYTSVYDLIVFRRLATQAELAAKDADAQPVASQVAAGSSTSVGFPAIASKAVGFAVFDRLLVSVHPKGCYAARGFVDRFLADVQRHIDANQVRNRLPQSPADLCLRMLNAMVDSYLELRKGLQSRMDGWQTDLLKPGARFSDWKAIMVARSELNGLEDLCEEQHDAVQEWLDCMLEHDAAKTPWMSTAQHEQLLVRARDVLEHIGRVMHHAQRLEKTAETVVQLHFSAQSHRANDIMRTLTALTAIFLPLNLIAGIFGMNFQFLPWIHDKQGFWWAVAAMITIASTLGVVFWRKRYLARTRS
jgi:magnesium transporter